MVAGVVEPDEFFPELWMVAQAIDDVAAVPTGFAGNHQIHVAAIGPKSLERIESQAVILAPRNHADHQVGRVRHVSPESGFDSFSDRIAANRPFKFGPKPERAAKGSDRWSSGRTHCVFDHVNLCENIL